MAVLILGTHDQSVLSASVARLVSAGTALGGEVDLLLAGTNLNALAAAASGFTGLRRVLIAESEALAHQPADALAALVASLGDQYEVLVAASDSVGRDVMPRVAAKFDVMPVTDITRIHGPNRFDRPIYAGNAFETLTCNEPKKILTVRPTAFAPAIATGGSVPVEAVAYNGTASRITQLQIMRTPGDIPDLTSARIVVGGGQSLGSREKFALVEELASLLGAAVGATRAAVDAGYAPNDWQVGQTGKIIAPELYIAVGISGALQHLAGIQGAKKIIAINTDPEAPIVKIADFSVIGDLFEVVPQIIRSLRERAIE